MPWDNFKIMINTQIYDSYNNNNNIFSKIEKILNVRTNKYQNYPHKYSQIKFIKKEKGNIKIEFFSEILEMKFKIERPEQNLGTNKMISEYLTEFKYLRYLFIIFKQIIFLGKLLDEDDGGIGELGLFLMIIIFLQISDNQDTIDNKNLEEKKTSIISNDIDVATQSSILNESINSDIVNNIGTHKFISSDICNKTFGRYFFCLIFNYFQCDLTKLYIKPKKPFDKNKALPYNKYLIYLKFIKKF